MVWLWPGEALYAGASLRLDAHSGSVSCLAVGVDEADLTAATAAGFANPSHFSAAFHAMFGLSPSRLLATPVEIRASPHRPG